jgi:hypothetical protein
MVPYTLSDKNLHYSCISIERASHFDYFGIIYISLSLIVNALEFFKVTVPIQNGRQFDIVNMQKLIPECKGIGHINGDIYHFVALLFLYHVV